MSTLNPVLVGLVLAFICRAKCQSFDPAITQAPAEVEIYERQAASPSNFLGYTLAGSTYKAATCNSGDYFTTSSRWAGCVDGVRSLAVGCTMSSVVIYDATTATCPSSIPICGTYMAYDNPDKTTSQTVIRCSDGKAAATFYRDTSTSNKATSTTSSSTTSSTSSSLTTLVRTATLLSTITVPATVTDTDSEPATTSPSAVAATTTPGHDDVNGSQNLTWIAGPIVGGIAGIGIIALLVWIVLLLRKRKQAEQQGTSTVIDHSYAPSKGSPSTDTASFYAPGQERVVSAELAGYQVPQQPAELQGVESGQYPGRRAGAELE
ncbi:unnamed protein product [Clonostachys rosea]|uniref:Mid2 domain-containing protein n=1 Tax=Bionectria ochroleuca TaxID=29856 RepID=A0ABY6U574_BIOOC|nr:unnamed protein product [Clonostachys rosea]